LTVLQLEGVARTIGSFRLGGPAGINLEVATGGYLVILGPTGCGKTVLLETVAGIGRPDRGRILLGGADMTGVPPERRSIGFVYQRSMLFPHYSVEGNIRYGMALRRLPDGEQRQRVDRLAQMLGIGPLLGRDVRNLSGGESQKVALARALAIQPPLLLLDEPLAPLDPPTREALRREIKTIHRELGTTVLHVTHDQLTARILGQSVGVLRDGALQQAGSVDDVFERPAGEFVARFVGIENVLAGDAADGSSPGEAAVRVGGIVLRARTLLRGKIGLCVRPAAVSVARGEGTGDNRLAGRVRDVVDRNEVYRVTVDVGGVPLVADVSRGAYEANPIGAGVAVAAYFNADQVHCFPAGEA